MNHCFLLTSLKIWTKYKCMPFLFLMLFAFLCGITNGGQKNLEREKNAGALSNCPIDYITGGIEASDGSVWVIGERSGIYRHWKGKETDSTEWMCANYYQGYPSTTNFYGIAEDKQGRIWVGTDNQGVVVFNGASWKQYDRENALPGERIFDINVSPVSGEVAIATSMGLVIYNPKDESWRTFGRGQGLYADQVESLCFDNKGDLWLAYACGGVGKGSAGDNYNQWQLIQAPWYWDKNQYVRQPKETEGKGLPSNLCNSILSGPGSYVWVGTNNGIGFTSNGKEWKFVRGEDYWDKNKGIFNSDVTGEKPFLKKKLLPEDYVTSMALTPDGLWVGFWDKGAVLTKPNTLEIVEQATFPKNLDSPWVTGFLSMHDGMVYAMTYGNGLVKIKEGKKLVKRQMVSKGMSENAAHPSEPIISDLATLEAKAQKIQEERAIDKEDAPAVFWKEDWATQGDWCQRYGSDYSILCGANFGSSSQAFWSGNEVSSNIGCRLGCNLAGKKGGVRSAMGWLNKSEDASVLFNPGRCLRTCGTWMDATIGNGIDGSDLWIVIEVEKQGKYEIALYFYNAGSTEYPELAKRDNFVEIRKFKSSYSKEMSLNLFSWKEKDKDSGDPLEKETALILKEPVLARTRIKDTSAGGVYKTFLVDGPGMYYVRIGRNGSQGARLNGIFISRMEKGRISDGIPEDGLFEEYGGIVLFPSVKKEMLKGRDKDFVELWDMVNQRATTPRLLSMAYQWSLELYRKEKKEHENSNFNLLARWKLNLWNEQERDKFEKSLLQAWYAFQESKKGLYLTEEYFPESPCVLPISPRDAEIIDFLKIDWKAYVFMEGKTNLPFADLRRRLDVVTDEELKSWKDKEREDFYTRVREQMKNSGNNDDKK